MMKRIWVVLACLWVSAATAEVVHSTESGFEIKMSVSVPATPEQAYAQFLRVDEWWAPEHTWFGQSENLSIDPVAGGCFCEMDDGQSVLHMTVAYISPNREVRMQGGLGPLQQMGLHGVLTFKFIPISDNETKIVQLYRVTGYDPHGLKALAPIVDQVQALQLDRLRVLFSPTF
ncbi:MAG: hypothetical protein ACI82A_003099 [Candidatus Azotimanducaceae bacterium]|jgi:uncharacterized protein YndB with AHSA1/START domain